jgi:hypothetical protein
LRRFAPPFGASAKMVLIIALERLCTIFAFPETAVVTPTLTLTLTLSLFFRALRPAFSHDWNDYCLFCSIF